MCTPGLSRQARVSRFVAVVAAAFALAWVALWNGFPILYPDTMAYLYSGRGIWTWLLRIPTPDWLYSSDRSEIYAAGLYLLRFGSALAPVVVLQAAVMAWVLWLVVRSLTPARAAVAVYLSLVAVLVTCTSVSWYVSLVMPDILGPPLYFALYLLVFQRERLARWERWVLLVFAVCAIAAHATHLLVAASVAGLLALLWLAGWKGLRGRGGNLRPVAAVLGIAVVAMLGVHGRLYGRGHITLFGNAPPFLMARLIGDGPARVYLQKNCSTLQWELCRHVGELPTNEAVFLWPANGIWRRSNGVEKERLLAEQTPLLLATLRAYPREQVDISWHNFTYMLFVAGPADFSPTPVYAPDALNALLPGLGTREEPTRQWHDRLHELWFRSIERVTMKVFMVLTLALLPWLWRRGDDEALGLAAVVIAALVVNAFLSGVISCNDARLQDRVTWMIAFLAGLLVVRLRFPRAERVRG